MLTEPHNVGTVSAGREAFLEQVFAWVKTYGGKIFGQMRRMGISVDWSRRAFTMDDNLVAAVQEAFVRLHQKGLIYRENRLVNWCCTLHTAVSDIEVTQFCMLHHLQFFMSAMVSILCQSTPRGPRLQRE